MNPVTNGSLRIVVAKGIEIKLTWRVNKPKQSFVALLTCYVRLATRSRLRSIAELSLYLSKTTTEHVFC